MMYKLLVSTMIGILITSSALAAIKTRTINYEHQGTALQGYMAWDDSVAGKRPGVLIIHDWNGLGSYEKSRAKQIAELGYSAFALDMYGKGIRPKDNKASAKESGKYKNNRSLMRARAQAGLDQLLKQSDVNQQTVAVIGYCFGGTTTLELARSGAAISGAISFHGHLDTPDPDDAKQAKAKILVLHGADDPYIPEKQLIDFKKEMQSAHLDWQLVMYGNAVHSFTHREAGNDNSKGSAYNEKADKRSWEAMKSFLNELF